jgi:hypothetical protein
MNMIRVCGGLGNQFYQYAFGQALVSNNIKVKYNTEWYDAVNSQSRPFLLGKFNTKLELSTEYDFDNMRVAEGSRLDIQFLSKDNINYWGYWQSPLYHYKIYNQLKLDLQLKLEYYTPEFIELLKKIKNENSVSLHVRRGDYLKDHVHQLVLPLGYYTKALRIINIIQPDCKIYVFSDDIKWCKEQFPFAQFVHMDCCLDFELMKACKHNIIANSTFSWWSAYLNENKNKVVITPNRWAIQDDAQELWNTKQIILNNWIKCTIS